MMCENATKLASDQLDRRLSVRESIRLRLHLLGCDACSGFVRQIDVLRQVTRRYVASDASDPAER
jgi:predicted anti-sigma-YlaC factor YlaD